MDTISRENTSSPLPLVGVIAGVLGVILAAVALVKISNTNKLVEDHGTKMAEVETLRSQVSSASSSAETAKKGLVTLQNDAQNALNMLAKQIADSDARVAKLEESAKRPVAAAGKASAGPVVAGPGEYIVKPGDNPTKIGAANGGFSGAEVMAVNPGMTPSSLKVGQKIKLPTRAAK